MRRFLAGLAVAAAALAAPAAQAAVTYTFTGMQNVDIDGVETPVNVSFSLTRATFITNGLVDTSSLSLPDACSIGAANYACRDVEFNNTPNAFNVQGDFLAFGFTFDDGSSSGGGSGFFFFEPGAFGAAGTYSNDGWPVNDPGCCYGNAGPATLTVSGFADGAAVPEPGAWALMILGFGGAGAALRRRRALEIGATA